MSEAVFTCEEESLLKKTMALRESFMTALAPGGNIPDDEEARKLLLKVLDSTDATIHKKAQRRNEQKAAESQAELAAAVADIYLNTSEKKRRQRVANTEIPTLDQSVPTRPVNPGELEVTADPETFDSFSQRMQR